MRKPASAAKEGRASAAPGDSSLFLELMDRTEDAVLLLGTDLSILRANRCVAVLTGYSEGELRAMSLPELLQPKERRRLKASVNDATRVCGGSTVLRPRSGTALPIKYSLSPSLRESGRASGFLFVGRPWKRGGANEASVAAMERRKTMLEIIDEPVFIVDATSRAILALNKCAVAFSGYRPSDIVGKTLFDFLSFAGHGSGEAGFRGIFDAAYARRGIFVGVVGFERKGGARVSCDCFSLLMLKDDGRPDYYIVVMVDRTAADRREMELEGFAYRAERLAAELAGLARSGSGLREGKRLSDLGFTPRQIEIARLVFEGSPSKEVGRQLGIAESTVKNHLAAMFKKLGASSRVDFLHRLVEERIWIA
jgi:PAS domain S-box-containing protein